MKVIKKLDNSVLFKDLNIGDVFLYKNNAYIKIQTIQRAGLCDINCFDLESNKLDFMFLESSVCWVNAELKLTLK